ncbi:succinate dehydrogenase cytochrome b subunit [Propionibacteriaceae bacterium G1746]|uniref:succinate dehydrogenase cytochrome b subunit n=1 Tax=Aestuariimicrobium sp. G57 TaxID=3418485 RepID=UPI003C1A0A23
MAITGLILVAFLLAHMFGNFKMLLPDDGLEFNDYSHWLRTLGYPALPHGLFLWIFRIVLLAAVILHLVSAFRLRSRNSANVGGQRYNTVRRMESSYAARTMIWGGIIIVLFVIMHILQYTAQVLRFGYDEGVTNLAPYDRVLAGFGEWWVVLAYAVAMVAVCLHISHGFYSAFATLGANTSKGARRLLRGLAQFIAVLLFVGFMIPPVLILIGVIP